MKAEESDPFRWGHTGYKEHHPHEFVSSESDKEADKVQKKKKKKKTAKKSKHKEKLTASCERHVSKLKRKKRRRSSSHPPARGKDLSESDSQRDRSELTSSRSKKRKT